MQFDRTEGQRQPIWFLLLLGLAIAGGAVAYVPFLTVLLPVRIIDLTGSDDVSALSYVTLAGAVMASMANILFGWLSDKTRTRRAWILAGLVLSGAMLVSIPKVGGLGQLIMLVMVWQVGLNMMLGPLTAWAGDCVPDSQKGLLGGLFALAPALGALSGVFVTWPGLAEPDARLWFVVALVSVLVLPALIAGDDRASPQLMVSQNNARADRAVDPLKSRTVVVRMWFARLLVQVAEAALFAFLLFWLRSLSPDFGENTAANIFSLAVCIAVPTALVAGKWSDRSRRPFLPLTIGAAVSAAGLLVMALAQSIGVAIAGYVIFGVASMTFLSLHSGQTLRVLPRPEHRGRDLGVFNLTNTMPSMIIPALVVMLVPELGFSTLFIVLAVLAGLASLLIATFTRAI